MKSSAFLHCAAVPHGMCACTEILTLYYGSVQRIHHEAVPAERERICKKVWEEAKATPDLVLGGDDFASKKFP